MIYFLYVIIQIGHGRARSERVRRLGRPGAGRQCRFAWRLFRTRPRVPIATRLGQDRISAPDSDTRPSCSRIDPAPGTRLPPSERGYAGTFGRCCGGHCGAYCLSSETDRRHARARSFPWASRHSGAGSKPWCAPWRAACYDLQRCASVVENPSGIGPIIHRHSHTSRPHHHDPRPHRPARPPGRHETQGPPCRADGTVS